MDRRSGIRCPHCQGAATSDAAMPEGVRCRQSICVHNHQHVECARCKRKDLEAVDFKNGNFHYTCRECQNRWSVKAA